MGHLLDDYAFVDPVSAESAGRMRDQAIRGLEELGFLLNCVKSILTPTQLLKWLGVLITSVTFRLHAIIAREGGGDGSRHGAVCEDEI